MATGVQDRVYYTISNVEYSCWAVLYHGNEGDVVGGTNDSLEVGEEWSIQVHKNNTCTLQNKRHKNYASYNPADKLTDKKYVLSTRDGPQKWHIRYDSENDCYLISDIVGRYWTLPDLNSHTPIQLEQYWPLKDTKRWRITPPLETVDHRTLVAGDSPQVIKHQLTEFGQHGAIISGIRETRTTAQGFVPTPDNYKSYAQTISSEPVPGTGLNLGHVSPAGSEDYRISPAFEGVLAVVGFLWPLWSAPTDLDLPEATRRMFLGPIGTYKAGDHDREAFQVARWARDCFAQCPIPLTHPGGRGVWDAFPYNMAIPHYSWLYAYVFQRLIEVAALHPASRNIAFVDDSDPLADAPQATLTAVRSWQREHRLLFSFCFRLHRVLIRAGAVFNGGERSTLKGVEGFSWSTQCAIDVPDAIRMMTVGPEGKDTEQPHDREVFQVAQWALDCFAHCPVPLTHPGRSGVRSALPDSIRIPTGSWAYAYVFQRLIEIAALHPAGRKVAFVDRNVPLDDVPQATLTAVRSWRDENYLLFSFCFRLHRALIRAGAVFNGGE